MIEQLGVVTNQTMYYCVLCGARPLVEIHTRDGGQGQSSDTCVDVFTQSFWVFRYFKCDTQNQTDYSSVVL